MHTDDHDDDYDEVPNKVHDGLYVDDDRKTVFDVDPADGKRRIWREFGGTWNGPYKPES
jgi:hypothetical protein